MAQSILNGTSLLLRAPGPSTRVPAPCASRTAGGVCRNTMPAQRKILIHINNTNPILNEDSPERAELTRHGIEVSWDGMHIDLSGQP